MLDVILDKFFFTVGGTEMLLALVGMFLAYVIILSLIDSVIDL
ncbi:hypothetical protein LCGC14_1369350 [marine sediment metagenome]|uniref:Uncharacterized protein n=1 Tax=marine sediment metagenome TaxID=412755 RepID=A0A0F9ML12_9ZZZZ